MSHRALVAVARDGGFDVRLAPDGARDDVLDRLRSQGGVLPPGLLDGPFQGRARSVEELLGDHVDPLEHEAVVVVHDDGTVTPYALVPYLLGTADGLLEGEPPGALLALVGDRGRRLPSAYVRGWHHGTTGVLGEAVDRGLLATDDAVGWLDDRVHRLAGDGHRLVVLPPRR